MQTNSDLTGLRVAITGGTSGLGLALVRLLRREGAAVAFVARSAPDVERIAEETGAVGIAGDVGRKDDIYPLALQITGNLDGLDVLINSASNLGPTRSCRSRTRIARISKRRSPSICSGRFA